MIISGVGVWKEEQKIIVNTIKSFVFVTKKFWYGKWKGENQNTIARNFILYFFGPKLNMEVLCGKAAYPELFQSQTTTMIMIKKTTIMIIFN